MDANYCELAPSPNLAPFVECFWTGEVDADFTARILPDGCADLLFITRKNQLVDAQVVGVMTRPRDVRLSAGTSLLGVRFHPGLAGACLRWEIQRLNDRYAPIQAICGSEGNELVRLVRGRDHAKAKISAIEDWLGRLPTMTQVQRAIGELVGRKGQLAMDDFAAAAGVGERQLRRTCLRNAGLAPKQLARILRFREVVARLRSGENDMTELAFDCGYCDQSHMIREFRDLAGISPGRFARQCRG